MDWYEEDVQEAVTKRLNCTYEPKTIFYGSSSIRLWNSMEEEFKDYKPVNLGFGGSTLAACVWFFDRIVSPLKNPEVFILYAGDNDLGDGRHPEEVLFFFREFMLKLRGSFPKVPFYFISVKPSLSRIGIINEILHTNELIEKDIEGRTSNDHFINVYDKMLDKHGRPVSSFFEEDGLHLNKKGYALWSDIILNECLLKVRLH